MMSRWSSGRLSSSPDGTMRRGVWEVLVEEVSCLGGVVRAPTAVIAKQYELGTERIAQFPCADGGRRLGCSYGPVWWVSGCRECGL